MVLKTSAALIDTNLGSKREPYKQYNVIEFKLMEITQKFLYIS